jgi:3-oxoacyl-[acyl-carrier-protein] synthase-3
MRGVKLSRAMSSIENELRVYLLTRLGDVLDDLGAESPRPSDASVRFADVWDSMAMVEYLGVVADDCGCEVSALEECVDWRFSTVDHLARSMRSAGLVPRALLPKPVGSQPTATAAGGLQRESQPVWLTGVAARLPCTVQTGADLDHAIGRPAGWLERRAGILERRVWGPEDAIESAAACGRDALEHARTPIDRVGALAVVSEAPPLATGLAATLHGQLRLRPHVGCFDLGGACTGFLSALALGRLFAPQLGPVLIISVEAHSRWLALGPGPHGEAAALFGDGCAAAVVGSEPTGPNSLTLVDLSIFTDGNAADVIQVHPSAGGRFAIEMDGVPLTEFALHALATATRDIASRHQLTLDQLSAVVAHGGNGRMPAMLARLLHMPANKVWSQVAHTGNLGSASVPVAWASRPAPPVGPIIWAAVGAGLQWGAALWSAGSRLGAAPSLPGMRTDSAPKL